MVELAGKTVTIECVNEDHYGNINYYLEEDKDGWYWTESMFDYTITNADRIRNMNDEKLADFLRKVTLGDASRETWIEWLTSKKWE